MDCTVLYREYVLERSPQKVIDAPVETSDALVAQSLEIYEVLRHLQKYLVNIRPAYLSATSAGNLSERERDDIEYEVQQVLQGEHKRIKMLEKTCDAENALHTRKSWFADHKKEGIQRTRHMYYSGVFFALNILLRTCSENFQQIQKIRLSRKLERKAVRHERESMIVSPDSSSYDTSCTLQQLHEPVQPSQPQFDEAQMAELQQVLVGENDTLVEDYANMLETTHALEKSMTEIASLQSELSTHLSTQTEQINRMVDEAYKTSGDVDSANLQLKKAQQRNKRASRMIIYSSIGVGSILFIYDWLL